MSDVVTYYLCAVNVIAFLLYGADKRRAKRSVENFGGGTHRYCCHWRFGRRMAWNERIPTQNKA